MKHHRVRQLEDMAVELKVDVSFKKYISWKLED